MESGRDTQGPTVRVGTYNIRHAQGIGGLISNARTAAVILRLGTSVTGLTEVWRAGPRFDQPSRLAALTGQGATYHGTHTSLGRTTGNLILTAGTIHESREITLDGRREQRGCLLADIEVTGVRFMFGVVHLGLDVATRTAQLNRLAEELPRDVPLVLVGDFNATVRELSVLESVLSFSPDTPKTYPSTWPLRALDHIGVSPHWDVVGLESVPSLASDHRPLVADLRLRAEG